MIKEITEQNFELNIKNQKYSFVKIGAKWCAACKTIEPIINKISEEESEISFFSIDADNNTNFVVGLGIKALPSYLFYENGELKFTEKGLTENLLKQKIQNLKNG